MKKLLVVTISMVLILSLCACGGNKNDVANTPSDMSIGQVKLPEEEAVDEADNIDSSGYNDSDSSSYETFSDAYYEFVNYITEISPKEETVMYGQTLVLSPELSVFEYLSPLIFWGETLDDMEIEVKDITLSVVSGEGKNFVRADVEKQTENSYVMTIDTKKGEEILIQVEYFPKIDAVRLVAENNGEHALLFEYARVNDGYAAQYYFNQAIGGKYGEEPIKVMCVYRFIFSGHEGSCARFDDVEEPASLLNGVPYEEEFTKGATHWLTLKNDEFTGELNGTAF